MQERKSSCASVGMHSLFSSSTEAQGAALCRLSLTREGVAGSQQARFDELPPGALIVDCVCAGAPASPWLCRVSLMSQWTLLVIAVNWQQCQDYIALLQREVPTVICMGGGYSRANRAHCDSSL